MTHEQAPLLKDVSVAKDTETEKLRNRVKALEEQNEAYAALIGKIGEKADKSRMAAMTDELTGLLNRRGFKERYAELLKPVAPEAKEQRAVHPEFTVALLDLDRFKGVNDTFGHAAGDAVLEAAARYLASQARADDIIERYGGEEFLILFSRAGAQDILNKLDGKTFPVTVVNKQGAPVTIEVSFSGGIASFAPGGLNLEEAVRAADQALYAAKNSGRNKILVAEKSS